MANRTDELLEKIVGKLDWALVWLFIIALNSCSK